MKKFIITALFTLAALPTFCSEKNGAGKSNNRQNYSTAGLTKEEKALAKTLKNMETDIVKTVDNIFDKWMTELEGKKEN